MKSQTQQQQEPLSDAEFDRLMEEYETFQDMEESARRRADFKRAKQYREVLAQIEPRLFPWMTEGRTRV